LFYLLIWFQLYIRKDRDPESIIPKEGLEE